MNLNKIELSLADFNSRAISLEEYVIKDKRINIRIYSKKYDMDMLIKYFKTKRFKLYNITQEFGDMYFVELTLDKDDILNKLMNEFNEFYEEYLKVVFEREYNFYKSKEWSFSNV
jgi:hypothetical protein